MSMGIPSMVKIEEDKLNDAQYALSAIRAVSDLLCNTQLKADMNMVRPENLEALMTILADRLEFSLAVST